ncbi:hypothetical protein SAMN04488004_107213 [Loktanella salsilacus]|uniref:Uncharacterized protein n=2 Tax=Loktanella salsilacus TaxID=195913 RepID=A0A1I4EYQ5_9RHOB|nr:hypothetical protein SAMN04488004_107213 [Loktanella salsilacus]
MKAAALAGLLAATACSYLPSQSWAQSDATVSGVRSFQQAAEACRTSFPGAGRNPGDAGGWLFEPSTSRLCLYGTLEQSDLDRFRNVMTGQKVTNLIVRSAGGPVERWLTVGEVLAGNVETIYVDEACFSSCANYALVTAQQVVAPEASMVVWHGGPSSLNDKLDDDDYTSFARRTDRLYAKAGISTEILSLTEKEPTAEQMALVTQVAPEAARVAGYAISPDRLTRCYGFSSLNEMWHGGSDTDLIALANSKARSMAVLEFPGDTADCRGFSLLEPE